jgi:hypothetical protein
MDFVTNKDISRGTHNAHKLKHSIGKTLKPGMNKLKSLNLSTLGRQKAGMHHYLYQLLGVDIFIHCVSIGFEKVRDSLRNNKKHILDRRLRNKLKRRFAKENQGSIIGRPKKPPIMGSEKTDGKQNLYLL